ncbi:helix-turn-helix domain-containing protein [Allokutzneria sp. NRRL B-24872]|uniref:helix-turn-helix domain-containing protein n=1 Tax=Allokutzneria sp. NRRL B-24872 TaxID=1137961 RepID=UPI000A3C870B|nr:helix-turn-helix domain-containing protein [Allokutzneria sp. NRRL B-24872]
MSALTDNSPEQPSDEPGSYCAVLGGLLRDLRALRGVPLRETASAAGVDYSSLSRYELGSRKPPMPVLVKIAEFYEIPFFVLLFLVARMSAPEAVLPKGEKAVVLWTLLRYDEAQPPRTTAEDSTGDTSPRPPEVSANGADERGSGDGDGLAVTWPTRHDESFPQFEPVFSPVTPPETG